MNFKWLSLCFIMFLISCSNEVNEDQKEEPNSDIFSCVLDNDIAMDSLAWRVSIDKENREIIGETEWYFENPSNIDSVKFDVGNLKILEVTYKGDSIPFKIFKENRLKGLIAYSNQSPLTIKYKTNKSADDIVWDTDENEVIYYIPNPITIKNLLPIQTSPGRKIKYSAKINAPEGYTVLTSAPIQFNSSDQILNTFHQVNPISPEEISLIAGKFTQQKISEAVSFFSLPTSKQITEHQLQEIRRVYKEAKSYLGDNPWTQFNIVTMPFNYPLKGHTNPCLLVLSPTSLVPDNSFSGSITSLVVDNWTSTITNNSTWNDYWVYVAPPTYITRHIVGEIYDEQTKHIIENYGLKLMYRDMASLKAEDAYSFTKLKTTADFGDFRFIFTHVPKEKGYQYLKFVAQEYGDDKMIQFIKEFYSINQFSSVNSSQFFENLDTLLLNTDSLKMAKVSPERWAYETNIPKAKVNKNRYFGESKLSKALAVAEGTIDAQFVNITSWTAWDRMMFILLVKEKQLSKAEIEKIETEFNLSTYPNPQIQQFWIEQLIKLECNNYRESTRRFVSTTGRTDLLIPLYSALIVNGHSGFAEELLRENENFYVPRTVADLNQLFKEIK